MNKIFLIIRREYLTRVRKRSFLVMTILGPLLFASMIILMAWSSQAGDMEEKTIAVVETDELGHTRPESQRLFNVIPNKDNLRFQYVNAPLEVLKQSLPRSSYYGILHIPYNVMSSEVVELYTIKQPSLGIESHITKSLDKFIYNKKLEAKNISLDVIISSQSNVRLKTIKLEKNGSYVEQGQQDLRRIVGYVSGFLIYFFIFFYGSQVMRGIIEEKTSRIVEVIISSVRPFQLMMGKIIGIGLIGLTQFMLWIFLTFGIVFVGQQVLGISQKYKTEQITPRNILEADPGIQQPAQVMDSGQMQNVIGQLTLRDFLVILGSFLFYFISGYVLYGSLFAAVGAAVDSETDTQQFMLPVTLPLIFSIAMMMNAFSNPEGQLAVIFSIVPFTSPVVMMARIGFGIPYTQVFLSAAVLILTFVFTTWMAGKIYRTGILMYGKKATYKELWKWIRYKN